MARPWYEVIRPTAFAGFRDSNLPAPDRTDIYPKIEGIPFIFDRSDLQDIDMTQGDGGCTDITATLNGWTQGVETR